MGNLGKKKIEMRKKLKQKGSDERHTFTGTFERFGIKRGYKGRREDVYAPIKTDYKLSYPTKISIIGRQNK